MKNKSEIKSAKPVKGRTTSNWMGKVTLKRARKPSASKSALSTKDFRENPVVEQLYKTIYKYKLRKEAYKVAIEIYLNLKK